MKNPLKDSEHWSNQRERVRSNLPLLATLRLVKMFPSPVVNAIAFPVSFFYFLGAKKARAEIRRFQWQAREFSAGASPKKISAYATVLSFSLCLVERIEGWLGKSPRGRLIFQDDDFSDYRRNLESGKGVVIIGSHLGNLDLLRGLSTFSECGVQREIPVTVIMEIKSQEKFNQMLRKLNPKYEFTALDPSDMGPGTIPMLQEKISRGEIVVVTGDRTSAHSSGRTVDANFLGRVARFPYGIFLISALLQAPAYFVFGIRTKTACLSPKNLVFVKKSKVQFAGADRKERERLIACLCAEYAKILEGAAVKFPYQWYNFFDFWSQ